MMRREQDACSKNLHQVEKETTPEFNRMNASSIVNGSHEDRVKDVLLRSSGKLVGTKPVYYHRLRDSSLSKNELL